MVDVGVNPRGLAELDINGRRFIQQIKIDLALAQSAQLEVRKWSTSCTGFTIKDAENSLKSKCLT